MNSNTRNISTTFNNINIMNEISIKVDNLQYIYIGQDIIKFTRPGFSVKKGELVVVTGRSGCGKTTFLKMLAGHKKITNKEAEIKILGEDINTSQQNQVGYISQQGLLYEKLSLYRMLKYYTRVLNKKCDINSILEKTNLTECKKTNVALLSGGEKKRASLALELAADADIFLIDEPEAGLDSETMDEIAALFDMLLEEGKTIVCATHEDIIKNKADKHIHIDGGIAYVH